MSELREYQEKARLSKKKVVFCNWKRGNGKTYTISEEFSIKSSIADEDNTVVVISLHGNVTACKLVYDNLRENKYVDGTIKVKENKEEIIITNLRGINTNVKFIRDIDFKKARNILKDLKVRKVYCDEYIPDKRDLEYILCLDCVEQVKIFTTYFDNKHFDYISDFEDKLDKKEWISNQIEKLMKEYSSIPKFDNTTMRREKVLYQIKMLKEVFDIK